MRLGLGLSTTNVRPPGNGPAPFDPTADASALYLPGNYAVGTWTATVGTNLIDAGAPPAAASGCPNYTPASNHMLNNAVSVDATILGVGDCSGFSVVNLDAIVGTTTGNVYSNEAVWCDSALYAGLHLYTNGGLYYAAWYQYSGAVKKAVAQISLATNVLIAFRKSGGSLAIDVGSGWVTGDACGSLDTAATNLRVGRSASTIDGRIRALGFYAGTVKNDAFFAAARAAYT